jgi:hypothetical protein
MVSIDVPVVYKINLSIAAYWMSDLSARPRALLR